jgi:hypothetical protein
VKQQKPWFDEEYLGFFLDQRNKPKMQWLQDPSQSDANNLDNVRREAIGHFRQKRRNI